MLYEPEGVAANVAHVPVVYQVPPLITQPFCTPPVVTGSVPLPDGGLGGVGVLDGVGVDPLALGRYLIPVAGQSDFDPSEGGRSKPIRFSCVHES